MNNNIQEPHCSFEVSKLLKEKGFQVPTRGSYTHYLKTQKSDNPSFRMKKGELVIDFDFIINNAIDDYSCEYYYKCARPTHALAIEWIRVNFGIWFEITTHSCGDFYVKVAFCTEENWENLDFRAQMHEVNKKLWIYNSPQEATEAALLYVLNDLI